MKKLLIIVFVTGFVGLSFTFNPSVSTSSQELNNVGMFSDTTKTKKTTTTTKATTTTTTTKNDCSTKTMKSCCGSKKACDNKTKK